MSAPVAVSTEERTGERKMIGTKQCFLYPCDGAEICLIQPVDAHDLELLDSEVAAIRQMADMPFMLAAFLIEDWNRDLSPWEAPAVFGKANFGAGAEDTLAYITDELIPHLCAAYKAAAKFMLGGYSLAGLFSLWAGYRSDRFSGVAGISPSVWFPGWDRFIASHTMQAPRTYLSLGDREEKTRNTVMATVGDRIRAQYDCLMNDRVLEWNAGNHFVHADTRTAKGFVWLLEQEKIG